MQADRLQAALLSGARRALELPALTIQLGKVSALSPVHVHKASHHGSVNGETAENVAILSPEVVIISAGRNNQFGHPDPKIQQLYAAHGVVVHAVRLYPPAQINSLIGLRLMMARWLVEIHGEQVFGRITRLFPAGDLLAMTDGDRYFLSGQI